MDTKKLAIPSFTVGAAGFVALLVFAKGSEAPAPPTTGCIVAEAYGANATDALDDRAQLQSAIDACVAGPHCLQLGEGFYRAARNPLNGTKYVASLHVTGACAIHGAGEEKTTLGMLGTGIPVGKVCTKNGVVVECAPTEWRLLELSGAGASVDHLTLDGSARTKTEEQTHLLDVEGPAVNMNVEHIKFVLPYLGPDSGGDCIRLVGSQTAWVDGVTIRDVEGAVCSRSFLAVQRGVRNVLLERATTAEVGGQIIDFEPTGTWTDCSPSIDGFAARGVTGRRGSIARGSADAAVAGNGCSVAHDVTIEDSTFEDGRLDLLDATDVTIRRTSFKNLPTEAVAVLLARKRIERLKLVDVDLERVAGSPPGPVIQVSALNGFTPTDVTLLGARLRTASPAYAILLESPAQFTAIQTSVEYTGPADPAHTVVYANGIESATAITLVDFRWSGPLGGLLRQAHFTTPATLVRTSGP